MRTICEYGKRDQCLGDEQKHVVCHAKPRRLHRSRMYVCNSRAMPDFHVSLYVATDMICWVKFGFRVVKKSVTFCDFCKHLSTECALPAMPLSVQQQNLPGERYLMIAVETLWKGLTQTDSPAYIAMLIKGVFTLEECEAWLRAFPFDVMQPAQAEIPDLNAFFEKYDTVIWQTTSASSACGTIEASWWSPFKQAFDYEFDNLKLADEYTWEIWKHFLNHDASNADKKFADVLSITRVEGDKWDLMLSIR
jgi:hypothetical protein